MQGSKNGDDMLQPADIRDRLSRMCIARVARETGLAYHTVYRIAKGSVTNPNYDTMEKLSAYLGDGK